MLTLFGEDYDKSIQSDSINFIQDSNSGIIMLFVNISNKIIFFQIVDDSKNEQIQVYQPFSNIKYPQHGQQFEEYENVYYQNEVTKSNRWSSKYRLVLIKDDL